MNYEEKYKKVLEKVKSFFKRWEDVEEANTFLVLEELKDIFPELAESEDERIRKSLIDMLKNDEKCYLKEIAWLEKQVPIDRDKVVKGVRQGVATSLMNYIDANTKGMCLSNMECVDIENAIVSEDWDKVYRYMKKKLEKQGEKDAMETQSEEFDDNIITSDDEILQAISIGLTDIIEDFGWSDFGGLPIEEIQDWLEKQGKCKIDCPQDLQVPNGGIVLEDFNGGEGHYKVNLDYLNKKQVEEIEKIVNDWNKVKPKFKVGDWIISNDKKSTYQVIEVVRGFYVVRDNVDNHEYHIGIQDVDKSASVFTIQDAKDGDVLALDNEIFIYAHRRDMYPIAVAHCFTDNVTDFCLGGEFGYVERAISISPATKEQRDLLFSKMREAGYEWDAEKMKIKQD